MFGLGKTQSIKLERDLYDRVKKIADVAGYATVEEFISFSSTCATNSSTVA